MNLNEYQQLALRTAGPKDKKDEMFHLVLGLVGEAGEIAEKVKKIIRDHGSDFDKLDKEDLKKELGDVMWYIAVLSDYFDISLDAIGTKNIEKLASRQSRGTLSGSGDNR
ncbi:MAG TPA: nucleoside triphosphate pyrophosphohydrolase family protein [Candidatus Saccharibacteria bacterium]|nr:nucleoside triphosphate pyrophosphohydrolase family protein [Candidatus Saccharibacteria bacterium]HRQ07195.1 nucleoside triphosphate pyrophosphohydrolase family protein [Candidatus Saccharibacteria bacterium]